MMAKMRLIMTVAIEIERAGLGKGRDSKTMAMVDIRKATLMLIQIGTSRTRTNLLIQLGMMSGKLRAHLEDMATKVLKEDSILQNSKNKEQLLISILMAELQKAREVQCTRRLSISANPHSSSQV